MGYKFTLSTAGNLFTFWGVGSAVVNVAPLQAVSPGLSPGHPRVLLVAAKYIYLFYLFLVLFAVVSYCRQLHTVNVVSYRDMNKIVTHSCSFHLQLMSM